MHAATQGICANEMLNIHLNSKRANHQSSEVLLTSQAAKMLEISKTLSANGSNEGYLNWHIYLILKPKSTGPKINFAQGFNQSPLKNID